MTTPDPRTSGLYAGGPRAGADRAVGPSSGPGGHTVQDLQATLHRPAATGRGVDRRRPVVLALALLTAAAVVGTTTALLARQAHQAPATAPGGQAVPARAPSRVQPGPGQPEQGEGEADLPGGGAADLDALLTQPPVGVTWELFEGVAVPISRTDGPARADEPVHSGFSRTPTGALLAAAQIGVRRIVTPDLDDLRLVNERQLLPGPGRTAFLNLIASQRDNAPPAGGYAQTAGFQMLAFTKDVAVVSLATISHRGVLQASTVTLRWADDGSGGDWKVQLPASGLEQPRVLADLSGFVPWSGVSR